MRVVRDPKTQPCYACRERADVAIQRGHRQWYACREHADDVLAYGGVIVAGDRRSTSRSGGGRTGDRDG
jgi:hypothetical protein